MRTDPRPAPPLTCSPPSSPDEGVGLGRGRVLCAPDLVPRPERQANRQVSGGAGRPEAVASGEASGGAIPVGPKHHPTTTSQRMTNLLPFPDSCPFLVSPCGVKGGRQAGAQ